MAIHSLSVQLLALTPPPLRTDTLRPGVLLRLGGFGATAGPLVDAVHNQALLRYDVLPVSLPLPLGEAQTSLLIPPLLALTYAVLGGALPAAAEHVVGTRRLSTMAEYAPPARAAAAVASTVAIIKLSETLQLSALAPSSSLALLAIACTIQWAALDGTLASAMLALLVGLVGPLAELPFIFAGAWHYLPEAANYVPLGLDPSWAALSSITGPCYCAVTLDSIALGRCFAAFAADERSLGPAAAEGDMLDRSQ